MAKPIPATPTLTGKDAERFLKHMIAVEKGLKSEKSKETALLLKKFKCKMSF